AKVAMAALVANTSLGQILNSLFATGNQSLCCLAHTKTSAACPKKSKDSRVTNTLTMTNSSGGQSNQRNGVFIVIEGTDGSGKGTQFKKLHESLVSHGYDVAT